MNKMTSIYLKTMVSLFLLNKTDSNTCLFFDMQELVFRRISAREILFLVTSVSLSIDLRACFLFIK